MLKLIQRIKQAITLYGLFGNTDDILNYLMLYKLYGSNDKKTISFRLRRPDGVTQVCRYYTTDVMVFWSTFCQKYHLPPYRLPSRCIILDLGANVGFTMTHFATLYPEATIIGVEMDKANYDIALINTEWCRNRCNVINSAIWMENGEIYYEGVNADAYAVSLKDISYPTDTRKNTPAITIDKIIEQFRLKCRPRKFAEGDV